MCLLLGAVWGRCRWLVRLLCRCRGLSSWRARRAPGGRAVEERRGARLDRHCLDPPRVQRRERRGECFTRVFLFLGKWVCTVHGRSWPHHTRGPTRHTTGWPWRGPWWRLSGYFTVPRHLACRHPGGAVCVFRSHVSPQSCNLQQSEQQLSSVTTGFACLHTCRTRIENLWPPPSSASPG